MSDNLNPELYMIGGPRAVGKSTVLDNIDVDHDVINTGEYIYEVGKEIKDVESKQELLNNKLPEEVGERFVESLYKDIKKRDGVILDTHFYNDGFLGISEENLEYMGDKYEDIEIYLINLTSSLESLRERRRNRGLDDSPSKVKDDREGNLNGFEEYRDILLEDEDKYISIVDENLEETVEKVEEFIRNDQ